MIGPTDLLHPSPAPHFKTFQILPGVYELQMISDSQEEYL
jgi:hypothetical protein